MTFELKETIALLKDAVSIMIPVITGFVVLFSGSMGKLWDTARSKSAGPISWTLAGISLLLAVVSLFICFGVMSICIKATTGEAGRLFLIGSMQPKEMITAARYYLYGAYVIFACAVTLSGWFFYRFVRKNTYEEAPVGRK